MLRDPFMAQFVDIENGPGSPIAPKSDDDTGPTSASSSSLIVNGEFVHDIKVLDHLKKDINN